MALHTAHWFKYALIIWPVVSLVLTPFIARFLAISSDETRPTLPPDGEARIVTFDLVTPIQRDGLITFPRERA
jgi:hypothetical protein